MSARGSLAMSALDDDDDDAGDVVKVHYRFSAMAVRRVVDSFSPEEGELIRSIGFGGLLHLTRYGKLDRHFSAWLFNQLAAEVPITARDVHEVLGVPIGERPVGRDPADGDTAAVRPALGNMQPTLPVAEAVLGQRKARPLAGPMTQSERDSFVVAFVLFVVGHFLAPPAGGRREKVNAEIFHAVANPSEVRLFNWADYVLHELRHCDVRARQQVADGSSRSCSPAASFSFRYILYLDRLDLSAVGCGEPRQRQVQPRVAAFCNDILHQLIELDRKPEWRESGLKQFGKLKFVVARPAQNIDSSSSSKGLQPCRNSFDSAQHEDTNMDEIMDEFECFKLFMKMKNRSGKLSKLLNDSTCSAGSNASGQRENGPLDLHLTPRRLVDSNILNPIRCNVDTEVFSATDAAEGNHPDTMGFDPANSAPWVVSQSNNKEICANLGPKSQFEVPSKKRTRLEFPTRKGTKCASDHDVIQAASPSLVSSIGSLLTNYALGILISLLKIRAWVVHEEPTSIRVAGERMKPQMLCGGDLKADVCNLVMRLYSQLDDQVYLNNGTRDPRWRHFLPADWAVIAPVELEGAWSCYVWDFMEKKLSILDPLLSRNGGNEPVIRSKHSRAAPLLLDALLACRSQYCNSHGYGGQELNHNSWATNILGNFGGSRTFHEQVKKMDCKELSAAILTDDLVVEILSRLPFKSFSRFKCVCKAWLAFSFDPHYSQKLPKAHNGGFFYQDRHNSSIQLVSFSKHDKEIDGTLSFLPGYEHLEFVDCCNGLVLCEYRSNHTSADILRFIVCNPATQEWRILPDTQQKADEFCYTTKLGFNPSQSPHFYVFNFHQKRGPYNSVLGVSQVEMFSSCKSTWLVDSDLWDSENNNISVCGRPHVFIDGLLHVHTDRDVLVLEKLETARMGIPPRSWTIKLPLHRVDCFVDRCFRGCLGQYAGTLHYAVAEQDGCTILVWSHDYFDP
ncbi:hypothetical protein C2845_PM07G11420 [Panicum miliaceum]|uniref:F-box domain-containing protein n=1 Tax=Panicum miliaceum TaxID=4540 RepID=A0A3L6SQC0_PANMI|nr:hypothetical protein C2845_PM07G11420 [Panicum miliaceum]